MQKLKTHFEQIPLEVVKEIAKHDPENEKVESDEVVVETSTRRPSRKHVRFDHKKESKMHFQSGPDEVEGLKYPEWQTLLQEALLELDRDKLKQRVQAAETTIFQRLQEISQDSDHQAERQAIEDGLSSLRFLKRESLGFPDWERNRSGNEVVEQRSGLVHQDGDVLRLRD
jgi:hypothetical protein